jgi:hypothetical protein
VFKNWDKWLFLSEILFRYWDKELSLTEILFRFWDKELFLPEILFRINVFFYWGIELTSMFLRPFP